MTGAALLVTAVLGAAVVLLAVARRRAARKLGEQAAAIDRATREHAAALAALSRRLAASDAIIDQLPDPLLLLGANRTIARANAAAQAAFGAEVPAVLRQPALRAAIDRAFEQQRPQEAELFLPVPVAREVQATVMALDPGTANGNGALLVLSDRTRDRAVERMRADFVANASHELRTPLASLIGFIDTLLGPAADDPAAQRRFLGIMAEQAARMQRLIDDLLSLSRIELTEHQMPAERVALGTLVEQVAESFEPRFAQRRALLALEVAPDLPRVAADRDQIAQVLHNLIENALKYGREGGAVRLSAAPAPVGGRWPSRPGVLLAVADDGPGIPRAHIPRPDRAVLPGRQGPLPQCRRHRTRARHRQAHRQPAPRPTGDRERGGAGGDVRRLAAYRRRATRAMTAGFEGDGC